MEETSGPQAGATGEPDATNEPRAFELTSAAFSHGETIPMEHSCDGANSSPGLQWSDPPDGTQSFALIFDDPDAPGGTWVHWVLFNLPADSRQLPAGIEPEATVAGGALHGSNSWNALGYGGPCPPSGQHRYFFKLYALDTELDLEVGGSKAQVLDAMQGHVLAEAELMGTYAR